MSAQFLKTLLALTYLGALCATGMRAEILPSGKTPDVRRQAAGIVGVLDGVRDGMVQGWAMDRRAPGKPTEIIISVKRYDKHALSEPIGTALTNIARPDVNRAFDNISGTYGFSFRIPDTYRDGQKYYLYASVRNGAAYTLLGGSPKTFGIGQGIEIGGDESLVFNHDTDACEAKDIPDAPARAFRDADGDIQLLASNDAAYRMIGRDFDHLKKDCSSPVLRSRR